MSEEKRTKSGDHPAVKAFREKMESISEHTMPLLYDLNDRIDACVKKAESDRPDSKDPRREEDDDPRREPEEPPVDVVPDPFPSPKRRDK